MAALGGPAYRITYPNGDQLACIPIVYEATVESGQPTPDDDETTEVRWFDPADVATLDLNDLNRHLLAVALTGDS